jgi:cytoskeletal protein RodZ
VIEDDTVFSGALLRAVREARGWDLHDVAERTKITMTYLRAIEEENFAATPAPVYLRGFLKTIAKELRLPAERVALSYMERYQRTIELGPSHD